jgi:hypothetical protein
MVGATILPQERAVLYTHPKSFLPQFYLSGKAQDARPKIIHIEEPCPHAATLPDEQPNAGLVAFFLWP